VAVAVSFIRARMRTTPEDLDTGQQFAEGHCPDARCAKMTTALKPGKIGRILLSAARKPLKRFERSLHLRAPKGGIDAMVDLSGPSRCHHACGRDRYHGRSTLQFVSVVPARPQNGRRSVLLLHHPRAVHGDGVRAQWYLYAQSLLSTSATSAPEATLKEAVSPATNLRSGRSAAVCRLPRRNQSTTALGACLLLRPQAHPWCYAGERVAEYPRSTFRPGDLSSLSANSQPPK